MEAKRTAIQSARAGAKLRYLAAALSFAAELIHLWMVPELYAAWRGHGAFLLVVAACQGLLGASLLFGPGRRTLHLGILLNLGAVSVWAFTRTVGVPAWIVFIRLPVGLPDLAATMAELALVLVLVRLRRNVVRGRV